jgi:hypothetical protein
MAFRPRYRLGQSPFDAFLFAVIGEEAGGQELTVLSALSRLGLDPWEEAARLAEMTRQDAAMALAEILGRLPDSGWGHEGKLTAAGRAVMWLPQPGSRFREAAAVREAQAANLRKVIFWACLAAAVTLALVAQLA